MTIAESMAICVLRGDLMSARMLADRLKEELDNPRDKTPEAFERHTSAFGRDVWFWPEFVALARRLDLDQTLQTTKLVITIDADDVVKLEHSFYGVDLNRS